MITSSLTVSHAEARTAELRRQAASRVTLDGTHAPRVRPARNTPGLIRRSLISIRTLARLQRPSLAGGWRRSA